MSDNMKENLDLGLKLLVAFAASLAIYTSVVVMNNMMKFDLDDRKMLYNHDNYIKTQIAKVYEQEMVAKQAALKLYMETGDKSAMTALGMK